MPRAGVFLLFFLSLLARAQQFPTEANIRYDKYPETVLDVMQPHDPALKDRPAAIVIHGGGWVGGTKASVVTTLCVPFLEQGFVVANVEYRLASVATAPAAVTDVLHAASWFSEHASQYKVDPKKIIVVGHSAGGHLALLTGMLPPGTDLGPLTKIAAIVNFSGISDVASQLTGSNARSYAVAWIPEGPDRLPLAKHVSPITYVRRGLPPILTVHGDADVTVPYEQGLTLTNALKKAGDRAELITVPRGRHNLTDAQMAEVWPQVFKFLKKCKVT